MKKLLSILLGGFLLCFVTGCSMGTKTITCISEPTGENPTYIYNETYVVENNTVTSFTKTATVSYSDDYLAKISIDDILGVHKQNETAYSVEKLNDKELKLTYIEPRNVYSNLGPDDDTVGLIVSTMEENEFAPYSFKCEVK